VKSRLSATDGSITLTAGYKYTQQAENDVSPVKEEAWVRTFLRRL
jgi:hypothetical protein